MSIQSNAAWRQTLPYAGLRAWQDWRSRRVQHQPRIFDIDLGFAIHRERQSQIRQQLLFEVIISRKAATELRL